VVDGQGLDRLASYGNSSEHPRVQRMARKDVQRGIDDGGGPWPEEETDRGTDNGGTVGRLRARATMDGWREGGWTEARQLSGLVCPGRSCRSCVYLDQAASTTGYLQRLVHQTRVTASARYL
jgi:hypothetical protein